MNIQVFYTDGNYETFTCPALDFRQGYMIDNQRLILSDWREKGIRIDRSFWPLPDEDAEGDGYKICDPITIVEAKHLETISLVIVDGMVALKRDDEGELVLATEENDEIYDEEEILDSADQADDEELAE